jgi:propionyl-CoA carboxylase alpha chain
LDNHRRAIGSDWCVTFASHALDLFVHDEGGKTLVSIAGGPTISVTSDWLPGRSHARFIVDGKSIGVKVSASGAHWRLRWRGMDVVVRVRAPRVAALAKLMPEKAPPDTSRMLLCPMPGVVAAIEVVEGDSVEAGQALATVEAMKMENVLRAERKGVVKRIATKPGAILAADELIIEFE